MAATESDLDYFITENPDGQFIVVATEAGLTIPMTLTSLADARGTVQYLLDNTELAILVPAHRVSFT